MTLAIGNLLNGGTPKGQSDGFDLGVLGKISGLKDNNGESMLKYIVKKIKEENEDFPNSIKDLVMTFSTKKTDITIMEQKTGELSSMLAEAIESSKKIEAFKEPLDRFQKKMTSFIREEGLNLENIQSDTK